MRRPKGKPFCVVSGNGRRRWFSSLREAHWIAEGRSIEAYTSTGYWYFGDPVAVGILLAEAQSRKGHKSRKMSYLGSNKAMSPKDSTGTRKGL